MTENTKQRAVAVALAQSSGEVQECEKSLNELGRLLDTAGAEMAYRVLQVKEAPDPRTVIGRGKVQQIADLCRAEQISLVVFDMDLSPSQLRNLEEDIGDVTVIDRSMLILDIFAQHATSGEGKLQVELAQLCYTAPRLIGRGEALSRQGGGIGSRGPGESKLETDRRHLHERIATLRARLSELEHNRAVMRAQRDRSSMKKLALVGYTNAGKSTLLNTLTGAGVLSEDKLFATLDPTTRKLTLPTGEVVLLTDTVGFIRKLPHHLVQAFRSTLDEVRYADLLLILSDITDPEVGEHLKVTEELIDSLGAQDTPRLYVYNKSDRMEGISYAVPRENTVLISAKNGQGIEALLAATVKALAADRHCCELLLPYGREAVLSQLYATDTVEQVSYDSEGIRVRAILSPRSYGLYRTYAVDEGAGT